MKGVRLVRLSCTSMSASARRPSNEEEEMATDLMIRQLGSIAAGEDVLLYGR
jgi:hypothetical protein